MGSPWIGAGEEEQEETQTEMMCWSFLKKSPIFAGLFGKRYLEG